MGCSMPSLEISLTELGKHRLFPRNLGRWLMFLETDPDAAGGGSRRDRRAVRPRHVEGRWSRLADQLRQPLSRVGV